MSPKLLTGLIATRTKRALQTLELGRIEDSKTARLVAKLVSTDPDKQWRLRTAFGEGTVSDFCTTAADAHTPARASSLIELTADVESEQQWIAALLAAAPTITHLDLTLELPDETVKDKYSERLNMLYTPVLKQRKNLHTLLFYVDASEALHQALLHNNSIIVCDGLMGCDTSGVLHLNRVSTQPAIVCALSLANYRFVYVCIRFCVGTGVV
jgi:hypothetical protein